MSLGMMWMPFYRLACVIEMTVCATLLRKWSISNTVKALMFIGLQIILLRFTIFLIEYVNDDFLLQFNSELINSYYWFHEHRDIFTTFTLSIFASRFIDAL
jgi:hypothetical protein